MLGSFCITFLGLTEGFFSGSVLHGTTKRITKELTMVNYGERFSNTISLRISDKQLDKLRKLAFLYDCSESQYLRMLIDSIKLFEGEEIHENTDGDSDDQL